MSFGTQLKKLRTVRNVTQQDINRLLEYADLLLYQPKNKNHTKQK